MSLNNFAFKMRRDTPHIRYIHDISLLNYFINRDSRIYDITFLFWYFYIFFNIYFSFFFCYSITNIFTTNSKIF